MCETPQEHWAEESVVEAECTCDLQEDYSLACKFTWMSAWFILSAPRWHVTFSQHVEGEKGQTFQRELPLGIAIFYFILGVGEPGSFAG